MKKNSKIQMVSSLAVVIVATAIPSMAAATPGSTSTVGGTAMSPIPKIPKKISLANSGGQNVAQLLSGALGAVAHQSPMTVQELEVQALMAQREGQFGADYSQGLQAKRILTRVERKAKADDSLANQLGTNPSSVASTTVASIVDPSYAPDVSAHVASESETAPGGATVFSPALDSFADPTSIMVSPPSPFTAVIDLSNEAQSLSASTGPQKATVDSTPHRLRRLAQKEVTLLNTLPPSDVAQLSPAILRGESYDLKVASSVTHHYIKHLYEPHVIMDYDTPRVLMLKVNVSQVSRPKILGGVASRLSGLASKAAHGSSQDSQLAQSDLSQAQQQTSTALQWVFSELGRRYVWGGAGPKVFDCSGLLMYAWAHAGVETPRTSQEQYQWASPVSLSQLEPGDYVFFRGSGDGGTMTSPGHVGMYVGEGLMIDAPYTGVDVRVESIWQAGIVGFGRIPSSALLPPGGSGLLPPGPGFITSPTSLHPAILPPKPRHKKVKLLKNKTHRRVMPAMALRRFQ